MNNCWFCYKDAGNTLYHPACAKKFFGTAEVPTLELDDAMIESLAKQTVNQRIAVTGVQPKLSLTLQKEKGHSRLTIVGLWGEFILKPQHHAYPMMPETEDLTMHLARFYKIKTADHSLLRLKSGELAADAICEGLAKGDTSAAQLGKWSADYVRGMDRMRSLVCAYYSGFSFGKFVAEHPNRKGDITDLLIGDLFRPELDETLSLIQEALKTPAMAEAG